MKWAYVCMCTLHHAAYRFLVGKKGLYREHMGIMFLYSLLGTSKFSPLSKRLVD